MPLREGGGVCDYQKDKNCCFSKEIRLKIKKKKNILILENYRRRQKKLLNNLIKITGWKIKKKKIRTCSTQIGKAC